MVAYFQVYTLAKKSLLNFLPLIDVFSLQIYHHLTRSCECPLIMFQDSKLFLAYENCYVSPMNPKL